MSTEKSSPRVAALGRKAISVWGASFSNVGAVEEHKRRFPNHSKELPLVIRANEVVGGNTGAWGAELAGDGTDADFLAAVNFYSVNGRLPGVLDVPPNRATPAADGLFGAQVVGD